MAFSGWAAADP